MAIKKPWIKLRPYQFFLKIHRWAGLAAVIWLTLLSVTGIILDHPEWRWSAQTSTPSEWSSTRVARIYPATIMRYIAVSADESRFIGASERGFWYSDDKGTNWNDIQFEGISGTPQVKRLIGGDTGDLNDVIIATDDGIWQVQDGGLRASRIGLDDTFVSSVSEGAQPGTLLAVISETDLVTLDIATGESSPIEIQPNVTGMSEKLPLYRFIMDLHFGHGTLPGSGSLWLNDIGGIAMIILGITGILSWWLPKRWKKNKTPGRTRQKIYKWFFRGHAPVIGFVAFIPILLITTTAIPMNHILDFIPWSRGMEVERASLPPAYQAKSFGHTIRGAVAFPGDPDRLQMTTRFGILESTDRGQSWRVETSLPLPPSMNMTGGGLFRVGDRVFAAFSGGRNFWRRDGDTEWHKIDGPQRAITSAARAGDDVWFVKNSKAIFRGNFAEGAAPMVESGVTFRNAAPGTPLYLFAADVHAGVIFQDDFGYFNDIITILAILLALSGPIIWLRKNGFSTKVSWPTKMATKH